MYFRLSYAGSLDLCFSSAIHERCEDIGPATVVVADWSRDHNTLGNEQLGRPETDGKKQVNTSKKFLSNLRRRLHWPLEDKPTLNSMRYRKSDETTIGR